MTWEYTEELGDSIANYLAEGYSMRQIAGFEGMPSRATMMRWLRDDSKSFDTKCARGRIVQGEMSIEEHREIIDKTLSGEITSDVARVVLSSLEWRAKKLAPKKYGDKIAVDNNHNGTIEITGVLSPLSEIITEFESSRAKAEAATALQE